MTTGGHPPPVGSRGFTLLEVLVALTILAIALGALVRAVGGAAHNAAWLEERSFAQWVAENEIVRMQALGEWPEPGRKTGQSEMASRVWHWRAAISTTPEIDLRRVEITVHRTADDPDPVTTFTGFLARPEKTTGGSS